IAAVLRPARGLHVRSLPRLGADGAQESRGMERAGAHFHVVGLQQHAALAVPVRVELQDELLESEHRLRAGFYRLRAPSLRAASSAAAASNASDSTTIGQPAHPMYPPPPPHPPPHLSPPPS